MSENCYVKFWGVRGTIPTPRVDQLKYGGNTSCVEVRCDDLAIVFDAGTGIIGFAEQDDVSHMHLLLSHTHLDHIIGLCGMRKMFEPTFSADIWAGHLLPDMRVQEALSRVMSPPIFPIPLNALQSTLTFHDFSAGDTLQHTDFKKNSVTIDTLLLHHPDRATGYRVEIGDASVCYITDVEHLQDGLDEALIEFVRDCDIFIYDCTYDDHHFSSYIGWGHSTWQQGMRLSNAANVKTFVMFHHDPMVNDAALDERIIMAHAQFNQCFEIAREGLVIPLRTQR